MDTKTNKIRYPKSVLTLYLKLYCKRRNKSNKMLEGIQSWITLSKSEKQKFYKKYKECRLNHKIKLANYLSKTQPFMKKKEAKSYNKTTGGSQPKNDQRENPKNVTEQQQCNSDQAVWEEAKLEGSVEETANDLEESNRLDPETSIEHNLDIGVNNDEIICDNPSNTESSSPSRDQSRPKLAEPAPPSVRTARELFEMLRGTGKAEVMNEESWAKLPSQQKSRYQRALRLLKCDYIQKYKQYLESLSSKELFHCYNNFFD
ncbi:uncharacterized protein LOC114349788 isoform X1 [Ostrinia furnacalis]|uniref:uncharacterized protein LOC114349788 isoform X1 n=1 Tax=Ostrinia furnacalis TaxID=93504 RepID=UPI00103FA7EC|nr:uncharacterized protein LOC114349788 isoform X1 [Ostrinia furnacalis]